MTVTLASRPGMDDYLAKPIKVKEFLEKLLQLGGQTG